MSRKNRRKKSKISQAQDDAKAAYNRVYSRSFAEKRPKKLISFYMDEDFYDKLQAYAEESRVTRSHLMRQILMDFIRDQEDSQGKIF